MEIVIQIILTGIATGFVYALFALSISTLYRLTGIVHLALGELAGLGVFTTIFLAHGTDPVAGGPASLPTAVAAVGGIVLAGLGGGLVYAVAIAPFVRRGFSIAWIGGVVAAAMALRGGVEVVFGPGSYTGVDVAHARSLGQSGAIEIGGATVQANGLVAGALAFVLVAVAMRLLDRSRAGLALRAVSDDRDAAALCGVAVARLQLFAFTAAATAAGAVGLVATSGVIVDSGSASLLGLKGLVAAVAARFASPRTVVASALGLGLVETTISNVDLGPFELGPGFGDVVPIAVAILLLNLWTRRAPLQEAA
jgi:branched-chain amino acid transport system permease protein